MKCQGSVHVIPVPQGYTVDDAWTEIIVMGELVEPPEENDPGLMWAQVSCPGGEDCVCYDIVWVEEDD